MKLTDKIDSTGLVNLGFKEAEDQNVFVYSKFNFYLEVEVRKNDFCVVSIGKSQKDKRHYGLASTYKSIQAYCKAFGKVDFMVEFKGKFEPISPYENLEKHLEMDSDTLLKWVHYNTDNIKQIVSISECSFGATVWYIPNNEKQ